MNFIVFIRKVAARAVDLKHFLEQIQRKENRAPRDVNRVRCTKFTLCHLSGFYEGKVNYRRDVDPWSILCPFGTSHILIPVASLAICFYKCDHVLGSQNTFAEF